MKQGGGSIMVGSWISWEGTRNFKLVDGKMNKYVNDEILQQELLSTISKHGLDESTVPLPSKKRVTQNTLPMCSEIGLQNKAFQLCNGHLCQTI